ncbi:MAG: DEAD/DEAH box helicase [Thermodesulfobacteriota bacterium]
MKEVSSSRPARPARKVEKKKRPPRQKSRPVPAPTPDKPVRQHGDWQIDQFEVEASKEQSRFHDFNLPDRVMHAIADLGFRYCTPIQAGILEHTLAGTDATGRAQTGTGKSAAFLITILNNLLNNPRPEAKSSAPRSLIIAPTRELVMQICSDARELAAYTAINIVGVYGGMDYQLQQDQLQHEVDIVVATPGRLLDFMRKQVVSLKEVEIFVIDEADRMLDMGFIPDVRQIVYSLPNKDKRQTLFFSATLTPEVTHLASQWTKKPAEVEIEPDQVATETVDQKVYMVTSEEKYVLLYNLITTQNLEKVIVFCNRKVDTRRLTDMLKAHKIKCALLSGDVEQRKRITTLENFKSGKIQVLVATDVAGRGIHIDGISHVVNFNLPFDPEDYVHRIGRTGRAGSSGTSVSFACEEDSFYLPDIEEFLGEKLDCTYPDEELLAAPPKVKVVKQSDKRSSKSRRPARGGRRPARKRNHS